MKHKSILAGLVLIGVYCIVIWPKSPAVEPETPISQIKFPSAKAAVITRQLDRNASSKIVKTIPHKTDAVKENPLRKDPGFKLAPEVYQRNAEIETKTNFRKALTIGKQICNLREIFNNKTESCHHLRKRH